MKILRVGGRKVSEGVGQLDERRKDLYKGWGLFTALQLHVKENGNAS